MFLAPRSKSMAAVICSQKADTWSSCHSPVLKLKGLIRQSLNRLLSALKCSSVLEILWGMHRIPLAKITAYFMATQPLIVTTQILYLWISNYAGCLVRNRTEVHSCSLHGLAEIEDSFMESLFSSHCYMEISSTEVPLFPSYCSGPGYEPFCQGF